MNPSGCVWSPFLSLWLSEEGGENEWDTLQVLPAQRSKGCKNRGLASGAFCWWLSDFHLPLLLIIPSETAFFGGVLFHVMWSALIITSADTCLECYGLHGVFTWVTTFNFLNTVRGRDFYLFSVLFFSFLTWRNILYQFDLSSVQFSRSVVSDSLWTHETQHARPPCPSPPPGVHPNSCALNHPTNRQKPISSQACWSRLSSCCSTC